MFRKYLVLVMKKTHHFVTSQQLLVPGMITVLFGLYQWKTVGLQFDSLEAICRSLWPYVVGTAISLIYICYQAGVDLNTLLRQEQQALPIIFAPDQRPVKHDVAKWPGLLMSTVFAVPAVAVIAGVSYTGLLWVQPWKIMPPPPPAYIEPLVNTQAKSAHREKPEISLRLVTPESPSVVLVNDSQINAKEIKWGVVLWKCSNPTEFNPLRIPVQMFDWIKPGKLGGPEDIFSQVSSQIKTGDLLCGSAFVDCPECTRGKTYLVSIKYGSGGWFSEWSGQNGGSPVLPKSTTPEGIQKFAGAIDSVPKKERIPIEAFR